MAHNAFPAYAGMNRSLIRIPYPLNGVPRVCGDEPAAAYGTAVHYAAFPAYAGMNRLK